MSDLHVLFVRLFWDAKLSMVLVLSKVIFEPPSKTLKQTGRPYQIQSCLVNHGNE
jgi:hypothetical protein